MRRSLVLLLLLFTSVAASAEDAKPPATNLELLGKATREAVRQALEGAPLEAHRTILLTSSGQNGGNWFFEEYVVEELQTRGITVRAGGTPAPEPAPVDSAAGTPPDSAHSANAGTEPDGGLADSAGAPVATPVVAPAAPSSSIPILEYRILDLSIKYGGGHRRMLIGSRKVERNVQAAVRTRLLDGRTHEILWIGTGESRTGDIIAGRSLKQVEASAYPCASPQLAPGGFSKLVEPAVVTAIVAGLVYLFYTNQN